VNKKIERNYLDIYSLEELNESFPSLDNYYVQLVKPSDFQLNKFFYKKVGKKHHWTDRLIWTEKQWNEYVSDKKIKTYILKIGEDLAGYFELILHQDKNEIEIAYLGLLEEYQNQKLGSYLLSSAIRNSFFEKPERVWVHTCSLDHQNALKNYISRGMKIFKKETILA
jgi:ribosomal protein S18 acetylase RimI-like enzyme